MAGGVVATKQGWRPVGATPTTLQVDMPDTDRVERGAGNAAGIAHSAQCPPWGDSASTWLTWPSASTTIVFMPAGVQTTPASPPWPAMAA